MTYFDVFWLLKYGVLIALAVAISLAVTLAVRNLLRRTESGATVLQNEQSCSEPVVAPIEAEQSVIAPAPEVAIQETPVSELPRFEPVANVVAAPVTQPADIPMPDMSAFQQSVLPQSHLSSKRPATQIPERNGSLQHLLAQVEQDLGYQAVSSLLNTQEREFYSSLKSVLPAHLTLMCKVRAADFLSPNQAINTGSAFELMKLITTQYFTFLVCDKQTLEPVGFIELHDLEPRHLMAREARLSVLRRLSQEIDFPMVVLDIANGYPLEKLVQHLNRLVGFDAVQKKLPTYCYLSGSMVSEPPRQQEAPVKSTNKCCPDCGSGMQYRISRSGKYKGRIFHTCQSYPATCGYIKLMPVVSNTVPVASKVKQFA
jgi:hypothetical protein